MSCMDRKDMPERIYALRVETTWDDDGASDDRGKDRKPVRYLSLSSFVLDKAGRKYVIETMDLETFSSRQVAGLVTEAKGYRPLFMVPSSTVMRAEYLAEDVLSTADRAEGAPG